MRGRQVISGMLAVAVCAALVGFIRPVGATTNAVQNPGTLDSSGATIPDSAYEPPVDAIYLSLDGNDTSAGTVDAPVRTLNRAIDMLPTGGTVVVRGGTDANPYVYRDWYHATNNTLHAGVIRNVLQPITLQSYPHEKAWFDGTEVVPTTKWVKASKTRYYTPWSTPGFCGTAVKDAVSKYYSKSLTAQSADTGPCAHPDMSLDKTNKLAADPQMVFHRRRLYASQVTSLTALKAGSFFYDWAAKRIYLSTSPSGHTIEATARPAALFLNAAGSKVLGLGFRRYATNEFSNSTRAAVYNGAINQVFENDAFTRMAATGLGLARADGTLVNHSVFAPTATTDVRGPGGKGGLVFSNNIVNGNNTERFGTGCKASCANAGMKISNAKNFTISNNVFNGNIGEGFWCDLDCEGATIVANTFSNNTRSGMTYEVSEDAVIASNLVTGNGLYGLRIASANVRISNNTLVSNAVAQVWVYDDKRTPVPDASGPDTTAVSVVNNVISGTAVAVQGSGTSLAQTSPADPAFFTTIDHNSYYRPGGVAQKLFVWLTPAGSTTYTSLADLQAVYPTLLTGDVDDTGAAGEPYFVDPASGDYTVRPNSTAYQTGAPLTDEIVTDLHLDAAPDAPDRGVLVWTAIP